MSSEKARVVIVGAGILGSAVACMLAREGENDVLVLEAEGAYDQHSTGRSAAYYIPMYESVSHAVLAKASIGFLTSPPEQFSEVPFFRRDGAVIAAKAGAEASVESEIEEARGLGLEVARLDREQIQELVPALSTGMITTAAYYPDAGEIDVPALAAAYRRQAEVSGVRFQTGRRYCGARSKNGRILAALTDRGEIACEAVVNAAGAWAGDVASLSGATAVAPLLLRRHLLQVRLPDVPPQERWPFFRCPSLPLYFKLSDRVLTFSPMDADPTPLGPCLPDTAKVEAAISTLNAFTDLKIDRGAVRAIAGHRVFAPDHQPLIGRDPRLEGFFWAAGMGGTGIMASPAVGMLVSAAILGTPCSIDASSSAVGRLL